MVLTSTPALFVHCLYACRQPGNTRRQRELLRAFARNEDMQLRSGTNALTIASFLKKLSIDGHLKVVVSADEQTRIREAVTENNPVHVADVLSDMRTDAQRTFGEVMTFLSDLTRSTGAVAHNARSLADKFGSGMFGSVGDAHEAITIFEYLLTNWCDIVASIQYADITV